MLLTTLSVLILLAIAGSTLVLVFAVAGHGISLLGLFIFVSPFACLVSSVFSASIVFADPSRKNSWHAHVMKAGFAFVAVWVVWFAYQMLR